MSMPGRTATARTAPDQPGVWAASTNQAATFAERGVFVPFTTPMLAGARIRSLTSGRAGGYVVPELVMLNPSGARGQYVVPWDSVRQIARPTVHDGQLFDAIVAGLDFSPSGIAGAARAVAQAGFAGRPARAAAREAADAEAALRVQANFRLLILLVGQEDGGNQGAPPPEQETLVALHGRARTVIARLAPRIGLRPAAIAQALEMLGSCVVELGVANAPGPEPAGRLSRVLAQLESLQAAAEGWAARQTGNQGHEAALVGTIARVTASGARRLLDQARAAIADLPSLITRAAANPAAVAAEFARAQWVLDGWDQLCALHRAAPGVRAAATFQEIAAHAPLIPSEAITWIGMREEIEAVARLRRALPPAAPPGGGALTIDTIARNERLRADCLGLASRSEGHLAAASGAP